MLQYPDTYNCTKCGKLNHKFLRCLCWAKDDSDWPHKDKRCDYSFVSTCTIQVQWAWDNEGLLKGRMHRDTNENWGFDIDYIPETIVMDQKNPFEHVIWTPEGVAYNLKHAVRVICRYTESPRWQRYHVYSCGNIIEKCHCCCGDDVEENEFISVKDMEEMQRKYRNKKRSKKDEPR